MGPLLLFRPKVRAAIAISMMRPVYKQPTHKRTGFNVRPCSAVGTFRVIVAMSARRRRDSDRKTSPDKAQASPRPMGFGSGGLVSGRSDSVSWSGFCSYWGCHEIVGGGEEEAARGDWHVQEETGRAGVAIGRARLSVLDGGRVSAAGPPDRHSMRGEAWFESLMQGTHPGQFSDSR